MNKQKELQEFQTFGRIFINSQGKELPIYMLNMKC